MCEQKGVREHWSIVDNALVQPIGSANFTSVVMKETQYVVGPNQLPAL